MEPDPRLMQRLIEQLGSARPVMAYVQAAHGMACALMCPPSRDRLWMSRAADGMLEASDRITERLAASTTSIKIPAATSAYILTILRPNSQGGMTGLVDQWMSDLGDPLDCAGVEHLSRWIVLDLLQGRIDRAGDAVTAAISSPHPGPAWTLYDWWVAMRDEHSSARVEQCYEHFSLSVGRSDPALLVLGAILLQQCRGRPVNEVPRLLALQQRQQVYTAWVQVPMY